MSALDPRLAASRMTRDAARNTFSHSLSRVKADLDPATLTARVKAEVAVRSRDAARQAMDIAGDNRGIVVGAASALLLVLARRPIVGGLLKLFRLPAITRHLPWHEQTWAESAGDAVSSAARIFGRWRKRAGKEATDLRDQADEIGAHVIDRAVAAGEIVKDQAVEATRSVAKQAARTQKAARAQIDRAVVAAPKQAAKAQARLRKKAGI